MENLNNTDKSSDNAEKELRISDVMNSTLQKIFFEIYNKGFDFGCICSFEKDYTGREEDFKKRLDEILKKYCS